MRPRQHIIDSFCPTIRVWFLLLTLETQSLMGTWFYVEMATLSLIPVFFVSSSPYKMPALIKYIIVAHVSSGLYAAGASCNQLYALIYMALYIKYAIFPFCRWLYNVVANTNWVICLIVGSLYKCLVMLLCYIKGIEKYVVERCLILTCITFVCCVIAFWCYSSSWFMVWGHMCIASGSVIFVGSVLREAAPMSETIFIYCSWSWLTVMYLYYIRGIIWRFVDVSLYIVLLVRTPVSLNLIYKLSLVSLVTKAPGYFIYTWLAYCLIEQVFLVLVIFRTPTPKKRRGYKFRFI